jgi:sorbitol/mannitol transport system substrate-binding protein
LPTTKTLETHNETYRHCRAVRRRLLLRSSAWAATDLVIATVNNGHMIEMQKLSKNFEQANPDIKLKWVTLEEGVLRQRVTTDIATKGGQFDVMTIGMYETPIWGKKGWLIPSSRTPSTMSTTCCPPSAKACPVDGKLYARRSTAKARCSCTAATWSKSRHEHRGPPHLEPAARRGRQAARPAQRRVRHLPARQAGLGRQHGLLITMANTYGGQLVRHAVEAAIHEQAVEGRVTFYVDLMKKYGPPGAAANSFNENLALFNQGKCGIWIDATIAASFITDPKQSKVADKVAFAQSPVGVTEGRQLAVDLGAGHPVELQAPERRAAFINWATSPDYVKLVAKETSWANVPTGTRKSTPCESRVPESGEIRSRRRQGPVHHARRRAPRCHRLTWACTASIPEFQASAWRPASRWRQRCWAR